MMVGFDFRVSFERKLWIIFRFFVIRIKISIHVIIDFTLINLLQLKNL